ncbi:hypothetical protein U1Q18_032313 [Sarracenia purpurea var. burkii]
MWLMSVGESEWESEAEAEAEGLIQTRCKGERKSDWQLGWLERNREKKKKKKVSPAMAETSVLHWLPESLSDGINPGLGWLLQGTGGECIVWER